MNSLLGVCIFKWLTVGNYKPLLEILVSSKNRSDELLFQ